MRGSIALRLTTRITSLALALPLTVASSLFRSDSDVGGATTMQQYLAKYNGCGNRFTEKGWDRT